MAWSDKPLAKHWSEYKVRYLRNIAWVEQNCRVPEGKDVGKPVRLRWFQRLFFRMIYSTVDPCRTAILSVGRKNAKTGTSSFIILLHSVGPEARINSSMYSTAMAREQAAIVFNLAAKTARMNPEIGEFLTIRETVKELANQELGVQFKALSADAKTTLGLSPCLAIHDELGQVKGPLHELYESVETATAAQENPLSIIISTQAPTDGDLLSILIDDALEGKDKTTKVLLFTSEDSEDTDPFSRESVAQANPGLGDLQNEEEVMRMAEKARRMPAREASFRNLVLNQRVEVQSPFVSQSVWMESGEAPLCTGPCYGGLDLSETNDLTSLELVFPQGGTYDVKSFFWLPGEGLVDRSRGDRVPYDVWHKDGHIITTPGASIEYEFVAQFIADLFTHYDLRKIAFDRYNIKHLRPWLIKAGLTEAFIDERFVEFGQGFVSMSPAIRVLESLLLNAKLRHGNHPVLTMCAKNAIVKHNEAGDRKLDKKKSRGRIDGMVSLAMACAVANEESARQRVVPVDVEALAV